ncbi:flavin monoamine oxidase family protein [Bradyrhizobium sp. 2TAF24]|uniref:flavin monoamine oxidase family protein n=1 Tax=Bradyrhizobium sp. 2TAF24 TaxID=3233011 RepID=UPI003F8F36C8
MATFIPNLRPFPAQVAQPQAFVDTPNFVYSDWLNQSGGINAPIGKLSGQTVGIVGGGAAGCVAAFELQKCGAKVTLFDAETAEEVADKRPPGGRLYSSRFRDSNGVATVDIAEMGAMRFPPSEEALFYYLNAFNIQTTANFPDPGKQPTWVYYKGQGQMWSNPAVPPNGFERVWNGWVALVNNGITVPNGVSFWSSVSFNTQLQLSPTNGTALANVTNAWQYYLNEFGSDSFYTGLSKIFGPQHKWQVPAGAVWTAEDFTRFGTLGIGSGGFGPLYGIGFNYIYRLLTNALETDQRFVPGGISQLCQAFVSRFTSTGGSYVPNTRVTHVKVAEQQPGTVTLTLGNGSKQTFNRVIVAATTRAMEMGLSLSDAQPQLPPNQQTTYPNVGEAINRIHVTSSTKLFLRTKKFWNNTRFPRNILSDTKLPQLYTLDYGDPQSGVVLVTYTWEDDSTKTQALSPAELLETLKNEIRTITAGTAFSDYADQLVPYSGNLERDMRSVVWQSTKDYFGAFTLAQPGQDPYVDTVYRDFGKAGSAIDNLVYVAGDCTSWTGGWADGALQSGLNCAAGVIKSLGGTFTVSNNNPITAVAPPRYAYYT